MVLFEIRTPIADCSAGALAASWAHWIERFVKLQSAPQSPKEVSRDAIQFAPSENLA